MGNNTKIIKPETDQKYRAKLNTENAKKNFVKSLSSIVDTTTTALQVNLEGSTHKNNNEAKNSAKSRAKSMAKRELALKFTNFLRDLGAPLEVVYNEQNKECPFEIRPNNELEEKFQKILNENDENLDFKLNEEQLSKLKKLEKELKDQSKNLEKGIDQNVDRLADAVQEGVGVNSDQKYFKTKLTAIAGTMLTVMAACAPIIGGIAIATIGTTVTVGIGVGVAVLGPLATGVVGGLATWAAAEIVYHYNNHAEIKKDVLAGLETMTSTMQQIGESIKEKTGLER